MIDVTRRFILLRFCPEVLHVSRVIGKLPNETTQIAASIVKQQQSDSAGTASSPRPSQDLLKSLSLRTAP